MFEHSRSPEDLHMPRKLSRIAVQRSQKIFVFEFYVFFAVKVLVNPMCPLRPLRLERFFPICYLLSAFPAH